MGWMKCDGRLLNKITYNLLFQVIGYTFGGSGVNFKLPDPQGRVMGSVGPVTDVNGHTRTYAPGESVGELDHKLTIPEMPSHNHDNNTPAVANTTLPGNTSTATTAITTNATGPLPGGTGYGLIYSDGNSTSQGTGLDYTINEPNLLARPAALTITDPGHKHAIASNGGDLYHNNVQPSLFYGNTFIYSGIPTMGSYPYTTGKNPVLI